ncbi:MAG: DUF4870 domain-containing protein [Firmicutes bacterium]|jgi:uncharacterized membrane protein|nr:DUF4870 domain-containing protein [Bacillota bacterium]
MQGNDQAEKIGSRERFWGVVSYLLGWISGAIILLVEKKNKFIRFHAMQSVMTFGTFTVLFLILAGIDHLTVALELWNYAGFLILLKFLDWLLIILFYLALLVLVIFVFKAGQGEAFKLPIIGDLAEERVISQKFRSKD